MLYVVADCAALLCGIGFSTWFCVFIHRCSVEPGPAHVPVVKNGQKYQCGLQYVRETFVVLLGNSILFILIFANGLRRQMVRYRNLQAVYRRAERAAMFGQHEAERQPAWPWLGLSRTHLGACIFTGVFVTGVQCGVAGYLLAFSKAYNKQGLCSGTISPQLHTYLVVSAILVFVEWFVPPSLLLVALCLARRQAIKKLIRIRGPGWMARLEVATRREVSLATPPGIIIVAYVPSLAEWAAASLPYPPRAIISSGNNSGKAMCAICHDELRPPFRPDPKDAAATDIAETDIAEDKRSRRATWCADPLWELPCKHAFHQACCREWLATAGSDGRCPYCNQGSRGSPLETPPPAQL